MRISDTERQRTIDELRRHCASGRLDVDEYATRLEKAMASTTFEELDQLLGDLPMIRIAEPAGLHSRRSRSGSGSGVADQEGLSSGRLPFGRRVSASLVVLLSVAVVVATVGLALAAEFGWAVVLIAGWIVGLTQGRLARRSRDPRGKGQFRP